MNDHKTYALKWTSEVWGSDSVTILHLEVSEASDITSERVQTIHAHTTAFDSSGQNVLRQQSDELDADDITRYYGNNTLEYVHRILDDAGYKEL